jgi:hypothetical protein
MILDQFMVWLLSDERQGVIRFASENGKAAIERVTKLYERRLLGEVVSDEEWDMAWGQAMGADSGSNRSQDFASRTAGDRALEAVGKAANAEAWAAENPTEAQTERAYHEAYARMLRKLINLLETPQSIPLEQVMRALENTNTPLLVGTTHWYPEGAVQKLIAEAKGEVL